MRANDIRSKFIEYYVKRGHVHIPSAPLVPENDPTTLFTSSGMQPLVPYLLGASHPSGKRLVNSQKSFRAQDIDEVGDNRHTTFFEMLGNWSLGDYFKEEQLPWIFGFLTKELLLDPHRLYVTVFEGNDAVKKDVQSIEIWKSLFSDIGIDAKEGERIFAYPAKKNWWSRSGEPSLMPPGEPGGPDSEVFFDFGEDKHFHERSPFASQKCHPNCDCGRFMEIANSVFMQFKKQEDGSLAELQQKNVDFGGGLERLAAVSIDNSDVFRTDLFTPLISIIEERTKTTYGTDEKQTRVMRIMADHIRASVLMMSDGVQPSNKTQGYILRRLIRRTLLFGRNLGLKPESGYIADFVAPLSELYGDEYPNVASFSNQIKTMLKQEADRFGKTLEKGLSEIGKIKELTGSIAFSLYETYGFPWELTEEIARDRGETVDRAQFEEEFKKHKEASRSAASGMFKGGLADRSVETTQLHTATHMLNAVLHTLFGDGISQKGSHITAERLRFDFTYVQKITPEEITAIEKMVNEAIQRDYPVSFTTMPTKEALSSGAIGAFGERYGDSVNVYQVGSDETGIFSREICGGPHVTHTGELGVFKIIKEESAGAGVRRIYAILSSAK